MVGSQQPKMTDSSFSSRTNLLYPVWILISDPAYIRHSKAVHVTLSCQPERGVKGRWVFSVNISLRFITQINKTLDGSTDLLWTKTTGRANSWAVHSVSAVNTNFFSNTLPWLKTQCSRSNSLTLVFVSVYCSFQCPLDPSVLARNIVYRIAVDTEMINSWVWALTTSEPVYSE